MKFKIEFDHFGDYHRAAVWHGGKHIVALAHSWEEAERKLKVKLQDLAAHGEASGRLPASKEIEV